MENTNPNLTLPNGQIISGSDPNYATYAAQIKSSSIPPVTPTPQTSVTPTPQTPVVPSQAQPVVPGVSKSQASTVATSYGLKNDAIAAANPTSIANANYINALYQEAYGRAATSAELQKFSNKTVKDAANLILGQGKSPFSSIQQPVNENQSSVIPVDNQSQNNSQSQNQPNTPEQPKDYNSQVLSFLNLGYDTPEEIATAMGVDVGEVNKILSDNYAAANILSNNKSMNQLDEGYREYRAKIDALNNGTFTLTADEQAQVDQVQKMFDKLREEQLIANRNFEGAVGLGEIRSGRQEFMSQISAGNYKQAIDDGISKISDLELKAVSKISELKMLFKEKKYKAIEDSYKDLNSYLTNKQKIIGDIYTATKDYYAEVQKQTEFAYKLQQDEIANQFKYAELDMKQMDLQLNSDKFNYQQKQDMIENLLANDKFNWEQKQDVIKNQLEKQKFAYQQSKDAQDYNLNIQKYLLDVEKAKAQDTPQSRAEWEAMGGLSSGKTYDEFLLSKGKQSDKPPTVDQAKNAGFAIRMQSSNTIINNLTDWFKGLNLVQQKAVNSNLPSFLKSSEGQQLEQAKRDFINAILRRESGAVIADSEFDNYNKTYFPQPGESEASIKQKERSRALVLQGVVKSAGSALDSSFGESIGSNKYTNLSDYLKSNPDQTSTVNQIKSLNPKWTPDEVLQFIQSSSGGSGNLINVGGDTKKAAGLSSYAIPSPYANSVATKYPDGYNGGQCGDFAHKLVQFPSVGDSKQSKINAVAKYGIPADQWKNDVRVGDVIITGENPTYGHVAVVNAILPNGQVQLSESNYKQSNKVSNDRKLSINSSKIYGAIRGQSKLG